MLFENYDIILRVLACIILIAQTLYWRVTERAANKVKPKSQPSDPLLLRLKYMFFFICKLVLLVQLLGIDILPMKFFRQYYFAMAVAGFLLILLGTILAVSARKQIGTNWTHAFEYQIKKKHMLVTQGIYSYIRHPIYTGMLLVFFGIELLVHSYMLIGIFIALVIIYKQTQAEERLLLSAYSEEYRAYIKQTKRLFPFLW